MHDPKGFVLKNLQRKGVHWFLREDSGVCVELDIEK